MNARSERQEAEAQPKAATKGRGHLWQGFHAAAGRLAPANWRGSRLDDYFGLAAIALTGLWVLRGATYSWDFAIADGMLYFDQAHRFPRYRGRLLSDWSPLYVMFYSVFHLVPRQNLLTIYIVHRAAMLFATSLFVWMTGRRLFSTNIATVIAVGFMANAVLLKVVTSIPSPRWPSWHSFCGLRQGRPAVGLVLYSHCCSAAVL